MAPESDSPINPGVQAAIERMGGQRQLAEALGITQPTISSYLRHHLPPKKAIEIERLTGVSRSLLRPDIFSREGEG